MEKSANSSEAANYWLGHGLSAHRQLGPVGQLWDALRAQNSAWVEKRWNFENFQLRIFPVYGWRITTFTLRKLCALPQGKTPLEVHQSCRTRLRRATRKKPTFWKIKNWGFLRIFASKLEKSAKCYKTQKNIPDRPVNKRLLLWLLQRTVWPLRAVTLWGSA